ncbi:MAG: hypothetical protein HC897_11690, partial [Thermoanaerobaculia bacterium]|nr:hypothetical protein [Thermoanaerobaculia bacterium]
MLRNRYLLTALLGWLGLVFVAGCGQKPSGAPSSAPQRGGAEIRLLFTYGSEKEKWIEELTQRFNAAGRQIASGERIRVEAVATGSGDGDRR